MGQLEEKITLITGAGTGIGKGIARAFAREGAKLVLASRNQQHLDTTAGELRAQGGTAVMVPTDITDEAQVIALFERTLQVFGRLDILINTSGVFDGGPLDEVSVRTWQKVLDGNPTGPVVWSRGAMKLMKRQRGRRISNIGRISAKMPRLPPWPYTTTKHGLVGLTRAIALEGREFGIAVSCLHPGNVITERRRASKAPMDQEPMTTPDELAMNRSPSKTAAARRLPRGSAAASPTTVPIGSSPFSLASTLPSPVSATTRDSSAPILATSRAARIQPSASNG